MAERFRQPVLLMTDEVVGHMRERIVVPDEASIEIVNRKKPACPPKDFMPYLADPSDDIPPMAAFGDGYHWHITGLTSNDWGFPTNNAIDIDKKNQRLIGKWSVSAAMWSNSRRSPMKMRMSWSSLTVVSLAPRFAPFASCGQRASRWGTALPI